MRGKYDLPYYPGMEDLIDNLHIDLSIGKPVREVAIKLASILDTTDDYLNTMLQHDDIEVINSAAISIQKIVRGWNIRKITSLERY